MPQSEIWKKKFCFQVTFKKKKTALSAKLNLNKNQFHFHIPIGAFVFLTKLRYIQNMLSKVSFTDYVISVIYFLTFPCATLSRRQ